MNFPFLSWQLNLSEADQKPLNGNLKQKMGMDLVTVTLRLQRSPSSPSIHSWLYLNKCLQCWLRAWSHPQWTISFLERTTLRSCCPQIRYTPPMSSFPDWMYLFILLLFLVKYFQIQVTYMEIMVMICFVIKQIRGKENCSDSDCWRNCCSIVFLSSHKK